MLTAVIAWFVAVAVIGAVNVRHVRASIRVLDRARAIAPELPARPPRFVVLVPLLRERAVARALVQRMRRLDYPPELVTFVFVTTAREQPDSDGWTTERALRALLDAEPAPNMHVVHCNTGTDRCKADQLNHALSQLIDLGTAGSSTFIGVYDADSAPDPRVLRFVAAEAARTGERAFQQVPLYSLNLATLPGTASGYVLRARAAHNALFALTVELPRMRRQRASVARHAWSPRRIAEAWLSHALGHGQFFRADLLAELGGFRPPSCDTQLGHAMAYAGIALCPIPLFDLGETVPSLRALLEQGVVWFNSMNTFPETWAHVRRLAPANYSAPAAIAMTLRLVHSNLAWACHPIVFAASLVWAVASGHTAVAALGALSLAVYLLPVALVVHRFEDFARSADPTGPTFALSRRDRLVMIACFPLEKLFACVSPWLFAYRRVRAAVRGRPLELRKTERAGDPCLQAQGEVQP